MPFDSQLGLDDLKAAVAEADLRVLLMVLVHLTGDEKWLQGPFKPKRDIRLIPDPSAGLTAGVQQIIRDSAVELLASEKVPVIHDPGDEMMRRMMSVSLGEDVPEEYARMNREEMGLKSRVSDWPVDTDGTSRKEVLIVGAGVCGIALAFSLKQLRIPFSIVEKRTDVGGTWFVNRYPGCGVDTPNHSYSYSFGPRYRWPRYFSRREDVQAYITKVVDEFDIRSHIRFGTELKGSQWNEASNCWVSTIECAGKTEVVRTSLLVSAIGQLSDPSIPRIDGAGDYEGVKFHSTMWPDDLQVAGKNVAVIGTGATAMQFVPSIVDEAKSVVIYQRTPQWARPIPGYAEPIGEGPQWLLEHVPFYAEWFRFNMFWRYGDGLLKFLKKDPTWKHPDRSVNSINDRHRQEMLDFIKSELGDRQDLVDKCVPTYPPYGKRILLDNGWYKTLKKSNVELVVEPIEGINKTGIKTRGGVQRDADVIVYSTGFKMSEMAARLNITGARGICLADQWKNDNPTAYLGLIVPNFPNFFCMLGPGSGPAHGGSAVFQAECQARYISDSVIQMNRAEVDAIQVRAEVHDAFMKKFDAEHESLIWSHPGMSTYYRNSHGRVFSVLPWRFVDYWAMTHDPDLAEFHKTYAPSVASVAG